MAYFTPDVIARELLIGVPSGPTAEAEVAAIAAVGAFPTPLRTHYTASMPMQVAIRRPIHSALYMNRLIRRAILATVDTQALIRRMVSESFTVKRTMITPKFKELLREIYEFLKEEQT